LMDALDARPAAERRRPRQKRAAGRGGTAWDSFAPLVPIGGDGIALERASSLYRA
jgi:hypothetical protein